MSLPAMPLPFMPLPFMRRLAFAAPLAAALLASGCYVSPTPCDSNTLTVDWSPTDINGVANRTCAQVGVAYVDVWLDGSRIVDAAPCTDYSAFLVNVASGAHDVTVEGLDASLNIIDRDQFTTSVGSCGQRVMARPGEGWLRLDYAFLPVNQCTSAQSYLWFSLLDTVDNNHVIWSADGSVNATRYNCSDPVGGEIKLPVPLGTYTLDWIQEVTFTGTGGAAVSQHQNCGNPQKGVTGAGTFSLPVTLAPPAGASDVCF